MIKKSTINDKISEIIEYKSNGNRRKFSQSINFAPQVISNIVSGRKSKPSFDVLQAIKTSFDDINVEWLLTGQGPMLLEDQDAGSFAYKEPLTDLALSQHDYQELYVEQLKEGNKELRGQIKEKDKQINFLQDQVKSQADQLQQLRTELAELKRKI